MVLSVWLASLAGAEEPGALGGPRGPGATDEHELGLRSSLVGETLLAVDEVGSSRNAALHARALVSSTSAWEGPGTVTSQLLVGGGVGPVRVGVAAPLTLLDAAGTGLGTVGLDGRLVVVERGDSPLGLGVGFGGR